MGAQDASFMTGIPRPVVFDDGILPKRDTDGNDFGGEGVQMYLDQRVACRMEEGKEAPWFTESN